MEILVRSLVCVTLGKLLTFFDPQFPDLQNGLFMVPPSRGGSEDQVMKYVSHAQNNAQHKCNTAAAMTTVAIITTVIFS